MMMHELAKVKFGNAHFHCINYNIFVYTYIYTYTFVEASFIGTLYLLGFHSCDNKE